MRDLTRGAARSSVALLLSNMTVSALHRTRVFDQLNARSGMNVLCMGCSVQDLTWLAEELFEGGSKSEAK